LEIRSYINRIQEGLRSAKGRNILTFLIFLFISTIFWFLLALNDDVQEDYIMPVSIEDFPKNVTILSGYNSALSITVKDKGSALMKFSWGHTPTMKLRYEDFTQPDDTTLLLTSAQLNSAVRGIFGTGATIVAMRPDSLKLSYTSLPGIRVPVTVKSDIHTLPQYAYAGHPVTSVDSVLLYSNSSKRFKIHTLATKTVSLADLSDTVTVDADIDVPPGMRAVPSSIKVTFPVEPLVTKQQSLPVNVINTPRGTRVITFPPMVEVSYLIPKAMYGKEDVPMRATVDFNTITSHTKSLTVSLSKLPPQYRNISINPPQVEFVIEHEE